MLSIHFTCQLVFAAMQLFFTEPTFVSQTIDENISIGYGLALGDVDGDGKPDILLADKKQFVWYRNGDWKRFIMVDNLTANDNVCIAARDLNGDGKVEVAVGAQWNPGETFDVAKSGSVHYLIRPKDATQLWDAVQLHHEPTIHRMQWVKSGNGNFFLVVAPLHGKGNKNGDGEGVKVMAYKFPENPRSAWTVVTVDSSMHLTHNLAIMENKTGKGTKVFIAGKEGVKLHNDFSGEAGNVNQMPGMDRATGEIRIGQFGKQPFIATIEPMHGNAVAVYISGQNMVRKVLDEQLREGHALATADLLNIGRDQVIAGWRMPNEENKTGIKLYVPRSNKGDEWDAYWIDDNGIATEDLQILDLNADGKPDIVAAGRATKNLKIYWNKN